MATAEELIVAIKSEGVTETQQDLEGVEKSMEDTAESAGDSAEQLEGFSERFSGAMSAAVAALAIGAAGLLSQVPVLGEAFAGLGAIVDAVALKMDSVLRPVISPITDQFFEWANAINNAEGPLGTIIGVLGTLATVGAIVLGAVISFGAAFSAAATAISATIGVITTVGAAIAGIITTIVSLPVILAAAVAALAAFVVAYLTNWKGTRDKTDEIIGDIIDFVVSGFKKLAGRALVAVTNFASDVREFFSNLASRLSEWAGNVADDAREWGANLIQGFLNGLLSFTESVVQAFENVINGIIKTINRALDVLPDEVTSRVGVEEFDRVDFASDFNPTEGSDRSGGGRQRRGRFGRTGTGGAQIDGRQLSESTGRYRSDPSRRRGL